MRDTTPIILHTDASDYGVGGYFFQTVDGTNQLVAFCIEIVDKCSTSMVSHTKVNIWNLLFMLIFGVFDKRPSFCN